jgi:hypothetical protein
METVRDRGRPGASGHGRRLDPARLAAAAVRVATIGVFGVLPVLLLVGFLAGTVHDDYAFDYRQFWQGGRDLLDGVSPYPSDAALARAGDYLDPHGIQDVFKFPYPAGAAVAMVPFAALPFGVAAALLTVVLIAAAALTPWLLGVRDWRCYGLVFLSITVLGAIRLGTFTPLLALGLAIAWRYRHRAVVAGSALAACIVLKVFLWPVVVWLLATRRWAAAAIAAGGAAGATLIAWAAIGFDGLAEYPELVRKLTEVVGDRGYSLDALGSELGLGGAAGALPWVVGGAVLSASAVVARREDGDRRSFSLAIVASILLTPIVWLHYFMLLLIPVALDRRRLSAAWLLLLVFWATPYQETSGDLWRMLLGLAVVAAVVAVSWIPRPAVRAA